VLFQRRLGWLNRVTAATPRFRLFITGGSLSQTAGRTTLRLSVPESESGGQKAQTICTRLKNTPP
jgi:hypothetical protein